MKNERHVQLPNSMAHILEPKDLLIYLYIKKYMNKDTKEAFPSLETLKENSGASIPTIRNAISRLENNGYLKVSKAGNKNIYTFLKWEEFEPFSYSFLDKEDLTFQEKAYLVATQQYMFKNDGIGKVSFTNKELSEKINLSESSIRRCDKSLEKKEYMTIIKTKVIDPVTGLKINEKIFHLNELEQAIVFALQNHEDRITENETKIQSLNKDIELLMRKINELERKQNENTRIYFT